jgi:hypothetical protein
MMLAFLVLGGGLCLFDHDGDGADDHAMPQDLCWFLLVVPAVILLVSPLAPREVVADSTVAGLVERPLSVPVPPPRTVRSA